MVFFFITQIASGESIWGSRSKKVRLLREEPIKLKFEEKKANPQAFTMEKFVFSYFTLKYSHYIVLEAKCIGNWKSETH